MKYIKLFLIIPIFIFFCCNSIPPSKKDKVGQEQITEQNELDEQEQDDKIEISGDDSGVDNPIDNSENSIIDAQIILTAEETAKKIDTQVDVYLPEPDYNDMFNEPSAEIAETEDVMLPDAKSNDDDKNTSSETELASEDQVIGEDKAVQESSAGSLPDLPPPPPAPPPFVRPPQPPIKSKGGEQKTEPQIKEQAFEPHLTARNPVSETNPPEKTEISRTVKAVVGQYVEVPYLGSQWVFLGEQNGRVGLAYDSRQFDDEGQNFLFRAEKPGTFLLKFYKQDYLHDYYINDFVQVEVSPLEIAAERGSFAPPIEQKKITALPRWPFAVDKKSTNETIAVPVASVQSGQKNSGTLSGLQDLPQSDQTNGGTVYNTADKIDNGAVQPTVKPANSNPQEFLELARTAYKAGEYSKAIDLLDSYREYYPAASDEALWIMGQCFEANSPGRDIRSSLDSYKKLISEYPQSKYYNDSEKRITFLNKFYFNIR